MNEAQRQYERRVADAWRNPGPDEDDDENIVQDGQSVRVSLSMMDSDQRAIAEAAEQHSPALDAMKAEAAEVQAHADRYTAEREAQDAAERAADDVGQLDYEDRISNAWRHA